VFWYRNLRPRILLFLNDPEVPFTNNEAVRDLRMLKVLQVSSRLQTVAGAELSSILQTVRVSGQLSEIINEFIRWNGERHRQ